MISEGISNALSGLKRAGERVSKSASRIAAGENSPAAIVDFKLHTQDYSLQTKNVDLLLETEKKTLEILD